MQKRNRVADVSPLEGWSGRVGPRRGGAPKGWSPEVVGPRRVEHTHSNTSTPTKTHEHRGRDTKIWGRWGTGCRSTLDWPKSVLAKVGFGQSRFGQSRFWPKSVWPKSVLAKLGQTLQTPTLAKVGQHEGLAKVGLAKLGHDLPGEEEVPQGEVPLEVGVPQGEGGRGTGRRGLWGGVPRRECLGRGGGGGPRPRRGEETGGGRVWCLGGVPRGRECPTQARS